MSNNDKRFYEGVKEEMSFPVCNNCKWNYGDGTCRAFPQGIPDSILTGENDHKEPFLDQRNNIVFENISEE